VKGRRSHSTNYVLTQEAAFHVCEFFRSNFEIARKLLRQLRKDSVLAESFRFSSLTLVNHVALVQRVDCPIGGGRTGPALRLSERTLDFATIACFRDNICARTTCAGSLLRRLVCFTPELNLNRHSAREAVGNSARLYERRKILDRHSRRDS
jgi:hypothetical protein